MEAENDVDQTRAEQVRSLASRTLSVSAAKSALIYRDSDLGGSIRGVSLERATLRRVRRSVLMTTRQTERLVTNAGTASVAPLLNADVDCLPADI